MSTIAWRADAQELASDSMGVDGWTLCGQVEKTGRIESARGVILYGACGDGPAARRFRDWVRSGLTEQLRLNTGGPDQATAAGFIFPGDDLVVGFDWNGSRSFRAPFFAYGSGGKIALGALAAGASAADAVAHAQAWDMGTNGPVRTLKRGAPARQLAPFCRTEGCAGRLHGALRRGRPERDAFAARLEHHAQACNACPNDCRAA